MEFLRGIEPGYFMLHKPITHSHLSQLQTLSLEAQKIDTPSPPPEQCNYVTIKKLIVTQCSICEAHDVYAVKLGEIKLPRSVLWPRRTEMLSVMFYENPQMLV